MQITYLLLIGILFQITSLSLHANEKNIPAEGIPDNFGFIENKGQWDHNVKFLYRSKNLKFAITKQSLVFDLFEIDKESSEFFVHGHVISLSTGDINNFNIEPIGNAVSKYNYLKGKDTRKWIKGASAYKNLIIRDIYEGIDLKIMTDNGFPRYDFIVSPGADPELIELIIEGSDKIANAGEKGIAINTRFGKLYNGKLLAFQKIDNETKTIDCSFNIVGNKINFAIGDYDKTKELIIDPVVFASYFGGSSADKINSVDYMEDGKFVIGGVTESTDITITPGTYDTEFNGEQDAFFTLMKLSGAEPELILSTIFGGSADDIATQVAIDRWGNIYLAGVTDSDDLPQYRPGQLEYADKVDAFIAKFLPTGDDLLYSTFLGGTDVEELHCMRVDRDGNAYVAGGTKSRNFYVKSDYSPDYSGLWDAYVTKYDEDGGTPVFSTKICGGADDIAYGIDIDNDGIVYITGKTNSGDFPTIPLRIWYNRVFEKPFDYTYNGGYDAFAVKLSGNGGNVIYSGYFGGISDDVGTACVVDNDGTLFITGYTEKEPGEQTFPISDNAFESDIRGDKDIFVAKLDKLRESSWWAANQELLFSTLVGGKGEDIAVDMRKNPVNGSLTIVGYSNSTDLPKKSGNPTENHGARDIVFIECTSDGSDIPNLMYFGGRYEEYGTGVVFDDRGDIYVAGYGESENIAMTDFTLQSEYGGGDYDGFIFKNVNAEIYLNGPYGGEEYCPGTDIKISWISNGFISGEKFTIEYTGNSSSSWTTIVKDTITDEYWWSIPSDLTPGNDYNIRVSHGTGVSSSCAEPITILSKPEIDELIAMPEELIVCEGGEFMLECHAHGEKINYAWNLNGNPINGATDSVLVLTEVRMTDAGDYTVSVGGFCQPVAESDPVRLTVVKGTEVSQSPEDKTIKENSNVVFKVEALGKDLEYQWFKDGQEILNMKSDSLMIEGVSMADSGMYHCEIIGECGEAESDAAKLTVLKDSDVFESNGGLSSGLLKILSVHENSNGILTAEINSGTFMEAEISICDNIGNLVLPGNKKTLSQGLTEMEFNVSKLSSGVFWLIVRSGKEVAAAKFVVVK